MKLNHSWSFVLPFSLRVLAGCASSDSEPFEGQEEGYEQEGDPGQSVTTWDELRYEFSPSGVRSGCAFSNVTVDANFRYVFTNCRGQQTGWINQKKIASLKTAAQKALRSTGKALRCATLGLKPVMQLGVKAHRGAPAIALRKFESAKDCVRGNSEDTEALNNFMSELLSQLQRR